MAPCAQCGGEVQGRFRYCPWCAAPQRRKLVEFFRADRRDAGKALRVSRYLDERHVRFSVWDESGRAEAAVSLDEREAARLAHFLGTPRPRPRTIDALIETLRL
ncbi:MAG: hypothetical protein M3540_08845 [Actinomycetota bacterium]|nr:hypothetical protein [Actinomycetota bacterium]